MDKNGRTRRFLKFSAITAFFLLKGTIAGAQQPGTLTNGSKSSNIITAVPFLLIAPDARTGSMGEASVAVEPDGNAISGNAAKLPFLNDRAGLAASYSPWLKNVIADINLAYVSGFFKLDENQVMASSLRYFSIGNVELKDLTQQDLGVYNPNELAFDIAYAKKFGEEFALSTTLRLIYSNLISGQFSSARNSRAGKSFAVDVGAYYRKTTVFFNKDAIFSLGANVSNIGAKLGYAESGTPYFLPSNLKIGVSATILADDYSRFTFAVDLNKLLVPTQPLRDLDGHITAGKDPNVSVPAGIFGSFSDAPGGLSEELKEINVATGFEYSYNNQFALRAGYFYEAPEKGDRRYFTLGAGFKYKALGLDLSYLAADVKKNPMANTLRFTLLFNFR